MGRYLELYLVRALCPYIAGTIPSRYENSNRQTTFQKHKPGNSIREMSKLNKTSERNAGNGGVGSSMIVPPPTVEFTRGSIVESVHRAHVAIVDSHGELVYSLGDPDFVTFMRSSAKPLQTLSAVMSGAVDEYKLTDAETSMLSGSHGGEPYQVETVESILNKGGLDPSYLQCGTHPPLDAKAKMDLIHAGKKPQPIHHNCSGKHAGMLITTKFMGEPLDKYLDMDSKVQQQISGYIGTLADIPPDSFEMGLDGCSAPVHGFSLRAAAYAFARLLDPSDLDSDLATASRRVTRTMRAYPEMIGAQNDRICTELLRAGRIFELTAKGGAEGYYSAAWRDTKTGRALGLAVKLEDGIERARSPLVIALLQKFGVLPNELSQSLKPFAPGTIHNSRREEIGYIKIRI